MFEDIVFPPASSTSKLSSSPAEKIPKPTDWIFEDFFNSVLEGHESPSINQLSELLTQADSLSRSFGKHDSLLSGLYVTYHEDDLLSLPDLEHNKSSDGEDDEALDDRYENYNFYDRRLLKSPIPAPILIESEISFSSSLSSMKSISSPSYHNYTAHYVLNDTQIQGLSKRKSNASNSSLKCLMNVFQSGKKNKIENGLNLSQQKVKSNSIKSKITRKISKCFKALS